MQYQHNFTTQQIQNQINEFITELDKNINIPNENDLDRLIYLELENFSFKQKANITLNLLYLVNEYEIYQKHIEDQENQLSQNAQKINKQIAEKENGQKMINNQNKCENQIENENNIVHQKIDENQQQQNKLTQNEKIQQKILERHLEKKLQQNNENIINSQQSSSDISENNSFCSESGYKSDFESDDELELQKQLMKFEEDRFCDDEQDISDNEQQKVLDKLNKNNYSLKQGQNNKTQNQFNHQQKNLKNKSQQFQIQEQSEIIQDENQIYTQEQQNDFTIIYEFIQKQITKQDFKPHLNPIQYSMYKCWLGLCYLWGRGLIYPEKLKGLQMVLEENMSKYKPSISFTILGLCYRWGYLEEVEINYQKSFQYLKKSAELKDRRGLYELGNRYFWGEGTLKQEDEALPLWYRSAQQGYVHAQYMVGTLLIKGKRGMDMNIEKGLEFLKKACDQQYIKAVRYLENYLKELEAEEYQKKNRENENEKSLQIFTDDFYK